MYDPEKKATSADVAMSGQRRRKVFMVAVLGRNLIVLNIAWVTGQDIIKASKVEIFFFQTIYDGQETTGER